MHLTFKSKEEFKKEAIERLYKGENLLGEKGILKPFIQEILQAALEGEMEYHLQQTIESGQLNRRNGRGAKTVKTSNGSVDLKPPRDRLGTFRPQMIEKRQTVLNESLDRKVLSLFGLGMSYPGIVKQLSEIYGLEVSHGQMSLITDRLLPVIEQWRSRPLDSVYAMVYLDAIHYKIRESGKVVSKAIYTILGVTQAGKKEVLGFYLSDTEGSRHWLHVLTDLKNRGVEDILIACIDGLKGFPEAMMSVYPRTQIQLCVVHQIRNSLKYVASKDQKAFLCDLKLVYQAHDEPQARRALEGLEDRWGKKYSLVVQSWQNKWDELSSYFQYPNELRKIIYTTNIVEGLHRKMRSFTKTKGAFTSESALLKLLYCACEQAQERWTKPLAGWGLIASQLNIHFEGRLKLKL